MTDRRTTQLAAAVAELRADYLPTIPEKLATLESLVQRARSGGDRESSDELRALAHRLRGTMGSYGFAEIGTAIGRIEDALAPQGSVAPRADLWSEIEGALQQALRLATAAE